jgi:hypothetical protein
LKTLSRWCAPSSSTAPRDERYRPFIPADRLQSELRGNFRRQGPRLTNVYARVQVEHTFAQNRFFSAFDAETATPGYTLVNAGLWAPTWPTRAANRCSPCL